MSETEQLEQLELERTKGRSVRFTGEEIAGASGRWQNGKEQNRWTVLSLYRTKAGKYILHREYITQWQGESGNSQVTVCANAISAIAALCGQGDEVEVSMDAEQLPVVPDEDLGPLESELLRRARKADPAFGTAAVEEVD